MSNAKIGRDSWDWDQCAAGIAYQVCSRVLGLELAKAGKSDCRREARHRFGDSLASGGRLPLGFSAEDMSLRRWLLSGKNHSTQFLYGI